MISELKYFIVARQASGEISITVPSQIFPGRQAGLTVEDRLDDAVGRYCSFFMTTLTLYCWKNMSRTKKCAVSFRLYLYCRIKNLSLKATEHCVISHTPVVLKVVGGMCLSGREFDKNGCSFCRGIGPGCNGLLSKEAKEMDISLSLLKKLNTMGS